MKLLLILEGMQTSKIIAFGAQKTLRYCRVDAPKTNHCLVRILVQDIIRPFFSENAQGETVTVNGDCYRAMMNKFLFTQIEEEGIGNIWFQQDGVTCHTAEATHDVLSHVLEDRNISRRADVVCNLGAAIWNHCTMICGVPSKISGTPTSQRQLTL